ncbi:mCG55139, isoform CRA_e, partial [Mus musculus]
YNGPCWKSSDCFSLSAAAGCCEGSSSKLLIRDMNGMTYDDVHVNFTEEEWALLSPSQKRLYKDVMLETYKNLTAIGYNWEDHNSEHFQHSRRHGRHERSHTGEKPSVYTQCGKVFAYRSHPQNHDRMHTGEKSHEGIQHGKAFAHQSHLQRHERIHTSKKPYECNQCGKAFAHRSYLRKHKRIHIEEKPDEWNQCGQEI